MVYRKREEKERGYNSTDSITKVYQLASVCIAYYHNHLFRHRHFPLRKNRINMHQSLEERWVGEEKENAINFHMKWSRRTQVINSIANILAIKSSKHGFFERNNHTETKTGQISTCTYQYYPQIEHPSKNLRIPFQDHPRKGCIFFVMPHLWMRKVHVLSPHIQVSEATNPSFSGWEYHFPDLIFMTAS